MASSPQRRLSPQGPDTRAETERHGSSFHTKTKSSPPGRQKSASPSLCDVRNETYTAHPELPDSQKGSREEELFPPAWPRPAPPPGARRQTSPLTHRPRAESLGGVVGKAAAHLVLTNRGPASSRPLRPVPRSQASPLTLSRGTVVSFPPPPWLRGRERRPAGPGRGRQSGRGF